MRRIKKKSGDSSDTSGKLRTEKEFKKSQEKDPKGRGSEELRIRSRLH